MEDETYFFERKQRTVKELKALFAVLKELNRLKLTKNLVKGTKNNVLDVGCGVGYLSEVLQGRFLKYTGLDILNSNIVIANRLYKKKNVIFASDSLFNNSPLLKEQSFDYVFLLELIEHVDNPGDYIRRCKQLLKKKGYLMISTPNATSITNILWNLKHRNRIIQKYSLDGTETDHVMTWDRQTLQNLLVKNGFKIINILLSKSTIRGGQSIILKAQKVE